MLAELQRHAIAGVAEIVAGEGGLPAVKVATAKCSGLVYLHGAHVAAWKPAGKAEILWMSKKSVFADGMPIRGGVPVCFPWFGPKKDGPGHGFVRLRQWELESVTEKSGEVTVVMALRPDGVSRGYWPQEFVVRHRVTFGAELTMAFELTNTGTAALTAEEALHTYFSVSDVRQVRVTGLAGVKYLDKMDGAKEKMQEGEITIVGETDRVYLETTGAVTIEDPGMGRKITVAKEHSRATVVWNPWVAKAKAMADFGDEEWPEMICVETCNVGSLAVRVGAGETHVMVARISAAKL